MAVREYAFLHKIVPQWTDPGQIMYTHSVSQNGFSLPPGFPGVVDFGSVVFPNNSDLRLIKITSYVEPFVLATRGWISGNRVNNVKWDWCARGVVRTLSETVPACVSKPVFVQGNTNSNPLFPVDGYQVFLSNHEPVFEPVCLFGSVWRMEQFAIYCNGVMDMASIAYWRMRLQFTFEL